MDRTQAPGPTGRATSGATTSTDSSLYTSGFELADLTSHHSSHRANANTPAPGTAAYPPPQSDTHSAQTLLFDGGPRSPQQKLKYVAHIGFAQALLEEKPKKWTRTMYKVYFFMGVAFLNSVICGYNASLIGGIRVMDHFEKFVACLSLQC